jgi:hypothetical protein
MTNTAFYGSMQAVAARMLGDKGQSCSITTSTPGTYDPTTATSPQTNVTTPVVAAIMDYPRKDVDGTLIRQGDKRAVVAAYGLSINPLPSDTFTDAAGRDHVIMDVRGVSPGGIVVIWNMQLRAVS